MKRALTLALMLLWPAAGALAAAQVDPVDWRHRLETNAWTAASPGLWLSPRVEAPFPFRELIYYWNVRLPKDQGFRLYLQAQFGPGDVSPWLYAGFWGAVKPGPARTKPTFDRGWLDEDTLLLKTNALAYQFKLVEEGDAPLSVLPALGAIATGTRTQTAPPPAAVPPAPSKLLDIPLRLQADVCGNPLKNRCQSAALASAMQYFGKTVPLEQIIGYTTDPEYRSFGIWPRTINAAVEHGFEAYLDRFRDWDAVRRTVAENKVILCSITMPAGDYLAPPYPQMDGHIVALCGVTDDGRVIVTDSAGAAQKAAEGGHCLQWLRADFEQIWLRNKGGVGMVICPPPHAREQLVRELPPFPRPAPARQPDPAR